MACWEGVWASQKEQIRKVGNHNAECQLAYVLKGLDIVTPYTQMHIFPLAARSLEARIRALL